MFGLTCALTIVAATRPATPSYSNDEAAAYIARLSSPPASGKAQAIDALFTALKTSPLALSNFDAIWLFNGPTEADSLLNILGTSFTLTKAGTVTHTPWVGITGNGSNGRLAGELPQTYTKAAQNSASIGIFVEAEEVDSGKMIWGMASGSTARMRITPRNGSGNVVCRLNGTSDSTATAVPSRLGLTVTDRNSATLKVYRDRTEVSTQTQASSAPSGQTTAISILSNNPSDWCADTISFGFVAEHLTAAQIEALYEAIMAYRLAVNPDAWD